jgi:hypothetical protein
MGDKRQKNQLVLAFLEEDRGCVREDLMDLLIERNQLG